MFLIFFFTFFALSDEYLDTLLSSSDLVTYSNQFSETGNISIDIKTSNYFIVFIEFPLNCTLYEYTSYDYVNYELSSVTLVNDIKLYHFIEFPFAKQIISMPNSGKISFTYGSMQDICTTGIILSNYPQYSITLSKYANNYTNIGRNEDKCIIFVIPTTQEYVVSLNGVNSNFFLYTNGKAINSFTGTNFKTFKVDAETSPTIFRFKSELLESTSIKISMKSNEMDPSFAWTVFHDPTEINHCPIVEECTLYKALHVDIILIVLGSILFLLICFFVARYFIKNKDICKKKDKETEKPKPSDWPSGNDKGEIRTEPTGYFAMDPILRNQHYS